MQISRYRRRRTIRILPLDPAESARLFGLRYVSDRDPGLQRIPAGKGFRYVTHKGEQVKDEQELQRIRSLAIPPAWTGVWICALSNGHLQAAGRDNRGRKQYRYHALYREVRNQTKFSRMTAFAGVLPEIRKRVEADLRLSGLSKNKVLATLVKLLEATCIRIGNEEYVQQNESFGLTTLRNRHVKAGKDTLRFRFKGKSGQVHEISVDDRRLSRIVHQCQALPGQELFEYIDEDGNLSNIHSEDVNDYLREITGEDFTAKDFRTWIGTSEAVIALEKLGRPETAGEAKKHLVEAIKTVAHKLGNRPATCKAYYVHPAIQEAYAAGTFFDIIQDCNAREGSLRREEVCALAIIAAADKDTESLVPKLKQSISGIV